MGKNGRKMLEIIHQKWKIIPEITRYLQILEDFRRNLLTKCNQTAILG